MILPRATQCSRSMLGSLRPSIAKLQAERDAALQLACRKKIERYINQPKQFVLDFGDTPDVVDAAEGIAASAHSDETFAAPLPAAHRLQRRSSHAYHRAVFSSHAYHRAAFSSPAYHLASRPVVTPCSSTLPLVLIVGVLGVGASATAVS